MIVLPFSWNDIISLSPSTMKKFTLKLSNHNVHGENSVWVNHFEEIMSLERKFQSMSVHLHSAHYKQSVDLLVQASSRYGCQIRSLTLYDSEFEALKDFAELMKSFPLLEDLALIKTTLKPPSQKDILQIEPVVLKELRSLNFNSSNWAFFQCIIGSQITKLSACHKMNIITDRDCFIRFLEASKKLEAIDIDSRVYVRLFEFPFRQSFPFKLSSFKFHWHFPSTDVGDADINFDKFLLNHASSLEDLQLNYVSPDQLRTIFSKLGKLLKLRINATSLPSDKDFYEQLSPLKNLKELIAHDKIPNEIAARGVLGNCPNLERLFMIHDPDYLISSLLPFIAIYNPNLKALSIETLKTTVDAKFKFLKHLHVDVLVNLNFLTEFFKLNPTIDTFSFRWINMQESYEEIIESLIEVDSLKHLKFFGSFAELKIVFDKVKQNYKNLKSLELSLNSGNKRSLLFNFPDEFSSWNPKCDFFDDA